MDGQQNFVYYQYLIVIILILISGCIPIAPNSTDKVPAPHVILDNPCQLPCWYHITPSKTTTVEAENVLQQLEFVDSYSIKKEFQKTPYRILLNWTSKHPYNVHGQILVQDGVVERLWIEGKLGLVLADIVDRYGPPEAYKVDFGPPATITQWKYIVFYPKYGAAFEAYQQAPMTKEDGLIYAEADIWRLSLLSAFTLEAMITRMFGTYPPAWRLYRWHGFDPLPTPTPSGDH